MEFSYVESTLCKSNLIWMTFTADYFISHYRRIIKKSIYYIQTNFWFLFKFLKQTIKFYLELLMINIIFVLCGLRHLKTHYLRKLKSWLEQPETIFINNPNSLPILFRIFALLWSKFQMTCNTGDTSLEITISSRSEKARCQSKNEIMAFLRFNIISK